VQIVIAGPTAVGKSAVALRLAERLNGEIISVDSMQVYRGMDVGTAKPSREERARVAHHLLDVVDVRERFDAARFVWHATAARAEIEARNRLPILCGGTGLYFNALLQGLGGAPAGSPALRASLEATPLEALLEELAAADPEAFARIDRQNPRRVIRALEVIRLTGKPLSAAQAEWRRDAAPAPPGAFCLFRPAEDLHERIHQRVDRMFRGGLVEETRALLDQGLAENPTAMQALGYRQVVEHLRGDYGLPEAIERVKARTRQFARRQLNWFRRQMNLAWIPLDPGQNEEQTADRLVETLAPLISSGRTSS